MASSLRERRRQLLREEIIDAAQRILMEKGFTAMSMEELAARAGVSKPTLYSQFTGKDELLVAIVSQSIDRIWAFVLESDAELISPLEQLLDLLRTTIRLQLEQHTMAFQVWLPEAMPVLEAHPASRERMMRVDRWMNDCVRAAMQAGEIDPQLDPTSVVRAFYALICSPGIGRRSLSITPDPQAMVETAVEIMRRGLRPPTAHGDA